MQKEKGYEAGDQSNQAQNVVFAEIVSCYSNKLIVDPGAHITTQSSSEIVNASQHRKRSCFDVCGRYFCKKHDYWQNHETLNENVTYDFCKNDHKPVRQAVLGINAQHKHHVEWSDEQ